MNDVCGSGLKALHLATQAIQCGEADIVIAWWPGKHEPRTTCSD
ncbi:beta-ketoacyl synthase N-terminal-like domain-containing protein [Escherichia coli]